MKFGNSKLRRRRNYRKEYDQYFGKKGKPSSWTQRQRLRRKHKTARNAARTKMKKRYKLKRYQDIDHKDKNPLNNKLSNLRIIHRSKNRSMNGKKRY